MRLLHLVPILGLAVLAWVLFDLLFRADPAEAHLSGELARAALPVMEAPRGERVEGRLFDPDGRPVRDALLVCQVAGRPFWTHSDASGSFVFEGLPEGTHGVLILARGFPSATRTFTWGGEELRLDLSERRPEAPRLGSAEPSDLSGSIAPEEGSDRFADYRLLLLPLGDAVDVSTPMPRWSQVDARGAFRVEQLFPGRYRALLLPDWAGESPWPDLLAPLDGSHTITYQHPPPANELVRFEVIAGAIRGSVLRLDRGPGSSGTSEGVEGATVYALPLSSPLPTWTFGPVQTNADGRFLIEDLPPGTYQVHARLGRDERELNVEVFQSSISMADFEAFD